MISAFCSVEIYKEDDDDDEKKMRTYSVALLSLKKLREKVLPCFFGGSFEKKKN